MRRIPYQLHNYIENSRLEKIHFVIKNFRAHFITDLKTSSSVVSELCHKSCFAQLVTPSYKKDYRHKSFYEQT